MINQIEPWIKEDEIDAVTQCITSTFVTEGKFTKLFEEKIQELHHTKYKPVAFCNATAAIFSALKVLGIKPNQEVLIPSLTFVATANAIIMAGGIPVCVDIDRSFNMDLDAVNKYINNNTFAIMPVHLYGHFTNVEPLKEICNKHGLKLIEDASQGVGVTNDNLFAGTLGDVGILSFYGNKFITSAQGGMVISKTPEVLSQLQQFKNHGRLDKGTFWHEEIGYNFCTSDLHSSLGLAQLNRLDEIKSRKKFIFDYYQSKIKNHIFMELDSLSQKDPCYWFVSVFVKDAHSLQNHLKNCKIQSRRAFPPLSLQPCYKNSDQIVFNKDLKSLDIYDSYLSLPSGATLTDDELFKVCEALNNYNG